MKQTTELKAERITKKLVLLKKFSRRRQAVELNLKRRCDDEDGNDSSIMKTEGDGGGGSATVYSMPVLCQPLYQYVRHLASSPQLASKVGTTVSLI